MCLSGHVSRKRGLQEVQHTRVSLPIKIILGIAVTLEFQAFERICRTVREWVVSVCNLIKEVDLVSTEHQAGGDRVNWSIAPSLVEEPSSYV